jgi:hypothetical protein
MVASRGRCHGNDGHGNGTDMHGPGGPGSQNVAPSGDPTTAPQDTAIDPNEPESSSIG